MVLGGIAVELEPRRPILWKMFSSSRKRGGANAFENDPPFARQNSDGVVRPENNNLYINTKSFQSFHAPVPAPIIPIKIGL